MPGPQDGSYDFSEPFNPRDWAMYHERVCASRWISTDFKLGLIMKAGGGIVGVAFTVMIGLLGWSLKTNYDNLDQLQRSKTQIEQTVRNQGTEVKQAVAQASPPS